MSAPQFFDLFRALARPFEPGEVKSRPQGGRQLQYITARTVMNRLDEVLGPANWWDHYTPCEHSVICQLTIRLPDGETVTKQDAGGNAGMQDAGDDDKSGFSDAFKRAAVKFGVGRYLYKDGVARLPAEQPTHDKNDAPPASKMTPPRAEPKPHHAANHDNGTGHGSGAYATPAAVKAYDEWAEAHVAVVNARWLDTATDGNGNIKVEAELVTTWQLTGHLLKHARMSGLVNAPADVAAGQRSKFLAVAWERHRDAIEAEAKEYCRHLWREARAKLKPAEPAYDEVDEGSPIIEDGADPADGQMAYRE
jgi:hypothetical protein